MAGTLETVIIFVKHYWITSPTLSKSTRSNCSEPSIDDEEEIEGGQSTTSKASEYYSLLNKIVNFSWNAKVWDVWRRTITQRKRKNIAQHNRRAHTRLIRYLRIPPSQTRFIFINILTYTNDKPHTTFENTFSR